MQIDAVLDEIDRLSSTQLYAIIVAVTVVISFVLLGTHNQQDEILTAPTSVGNSNSISSPSKKTANISAGPEPRWHIFKWINWLAITAFILSVMEFGWNADQYLHSVSGTVLFRYLVGWSVFLGYFFGFFGVSFVHDIHAAEEDGTAQDNGLATTAGNNTEASNSSTTQDKASARYVHVMYCWRSIFA
jgi:hypothetical protein